LIAVKLRGIFVGEHIPMICGLKTVSLLIRCSFIAALIRERMSPNHCGLKKKKKKRGPTVLSVIDRKLK